MAGRRCEMDECGGPGLLDGEDHIGKTAVLAKIGNSHCM
jgi:hypothetical protein